MKKTTLISLAVASLIAGCGGGGSDPSPPVVTTGTLAMKLTDAPACGFDEVNVTVNKIRVHQSATASDTDSGWTDIVVIPAVKINLNNLTNGVMHALGATSLAAGKYTQIRLILDPNTSNFANSVVPTGGVETTLITPSALQAGVKINTKFDIVAGQTADVALDFNACKSVIQQGNGRYVLKPVVKAIPMLLSGSVSGKMDSSLVPSDIVVNAEVNGEIVYSTVPDSTGAFKLYPLPQTASATSTVDAPASYSIVFTSNAHASKVVVAVPVTANKDTVLSDVAIGLTPSIMKKISGTVTPLNSSADISIHQSFGTNTLTMNTQAADPTTGAYSIQVPFEAPLLATYGTLPLTFEPQTSIASKYGVKATAVGFQSQTKEIDVSTGGQVVDFVLQ